ncbi:aminodeoxychorismate/anthranilate synthase component II [Idiomarina tyrosinivorans]|uniref:Aminodeoxychorismate/anthranilate synthase component II n=1 Tax=Idiomarina tyrosinivorans TaxID=1445662 RepID=A0A432ZF81_9GAMM|nr:aminodeoxychorismate/anthranilate synthase component II [Idiomarina tyrosinivorans]RUO76581.1 aminodeoxychorismate/anthranilate synthase component II [Idiomarina tyrosinivorans]
MILLLDNYDSFTFNLARYFRELNEKVEVCRNDQVTLADVESMKPDAIVISPGPCSPNEAGLSLALIDAFAQRLPILGVCLGHQALAQVFGAKIVRAERVMHGKTSMLKHSGQGLFSGLPQPLEVTRYHSLLIEPESLSPEFIVDSVSQAPSGAEEIMAIRHKTLPLFGVQFHPESVMTDAGHPLLANFIDVVRKPAA